MSISEKVLTGIGILIGIFFGANAINVLLKVISTGSVKMLELMSGGSGIGLIISIIVAIFFLIKIRLVTSLITGIVIGIIIMLILKILTGT